MAEIKTVSRKQIREIGFPEPVPFSEELLKSFSKEQKKILFVLADLAGEEEKLVKEIDARRPTPDGILQIGGALTVCEDEDDWKVITMGLREKRRDVREKIAVNLGEALDLDLGYLGIIQEQCANYGVKP